MRGKEVRKSCLQKRAVKYKLKTEGVTEMGENAESQLCDSNWPSKSKSMSMNTFPSLLILAGQMTGILLLRINSARKL
jgi:hypothetical protein